MRSLPCPKCGSPDVVETFCAKCLRELHPLIEKIKEPTVTFCTASGDVKIGPGWEQLGVEDAFAKAIEKGLVFAPGAQIEGVAHQIPDEVWGGGTLEELLKKPGIDREIEVVVTVTGRATAEMKKSYAEEYVVPVHLKTTVSPRYAKVGTQYFEGILQQRNERPKHIEALKAQVSLHPGLSINKTVVPKSGSGSQAGRGTDYFLTDQNAMQIIAKSLHELFGGELKTSAKLHTRDKQRSKGLYRVTCLLHYPEFWKDDVVLDGTKGKLLRVRNLGRRIHFENLETGKQVHEQYERGRFAILETHETTISQVKPHVAILDPETYQQVSLYGKLPGVGAVKKRGEATPAAPLAVDEKVRVVKHKNRYYFVSRSR